MLIAAQQRLGVELSFLGWRRYDGSSAYRRAASLVHLERALYVAGQRRVEVVTVAPQPALASIPGLYASARPFPNRQSFACWVASEAVTRRPLAPYTATGTGRANTNHSAGARSITAAACSDPTVSPIVIQKGFTGAAKPYPALTHIAPNFTTAAKSVVTPVRPQGPLGQAPRVHP